MDRYVIIDFQNQEIISANRITFEDRTDGSSVACGSFDDFADECAKIILEVLERAKPSKELEKYC